VATSFLIHSNLGSRYKLVLNDDLAACAHLAQVIAGRMKDRLGADGVNLLNCSGEAAKQTVFHFHVHVSPRFMDQSGKDVIGLPWEAAASNPDEIKRIGRLLA
jgi:histidine triad (HIT) family protein